MSAPSWMQNFVMDARQRPGCKIQRLRNFVFSHWHDIQNPVKSSGLSSKYGGLLNGRNLSTTIFLFIYKYRNPVLNIKEKRNRAAVLNEALMR